MVKLLLKCSECKKYYMDVALLNASPDSASQFCESCHSKLVTPHPPRFSMDNKYLHYIREMKKIS